jgi:hypothetical protein
MGYDGHITRAAAWTDSESAPIMLDEWLAYVQSDPEMRLDGFTEIPLPDGRILRTEIAGLSVWTGYSRDGQDPNRACFEWIRGEIVVKDPDLEILRKMHAIARRLGARVQGEDGTFYGPNGAEQPAV